MHYSCKSLSISAIIPAYNEARNITNVISTLKQVSTIKEIIVVDDGSTDDTAVFVRKTGGARIITLQKNVGKTKAALRGVTEAVCPLILFCDADLINLKPNHVYHLIEKYGEGYDMVIMDKGSQPWVFRSLLQSVPAVSGTRIMKKEIISRIPFQEADRFQFEIRINDYYLDHDLSIAATPAEEICDPRKYIKYPFLKGLALDLRGGLEVVASEGPGSIVKNLRNFRKIKAMTTSG